MVLDEEGGAMLVAPTPAYLPTSSSPATFVSWDAQVAVDSARIRGVYTSLNGATEDNEDNILAEISASNKGADIGLLLWYEDYYRETWP